MKLYLGKYSLCFLSKKTLIIFPLLFSMVFSACEKEKSPSSPGKIEGPENLCPGESGITYSIAPVENSSYYLWTVPEDAKIISGQGTVSIIMNFGKKSGSVCVRANNKTETSEASCMEVAQGGISNAWCREMDFKGGGRTEGVGFAIGNKGYVGTGQDIAAVKHNDFWEFDPVLNTWTQKADFAGIARTDAVGFSIGNKGYIGTGNLSISYLKDFWEYDPLLNLWLQKADCSDTPRAFAFGFSIGNKGYIGSGSDNVLSILSDFYEYDPDTDQWTRKSDVIPRNAGVGFSILNRGYFGLGQSVTGINYNDFWEFDPTDATNGLDTNNNPMGNWIQKSPFPGVPRYAATGFSIGNMGYIGMGYDGGFYYNDFFEFNPGSGLWTQKSNFAGEKRAYCIGFSIEKNGYIGIGNNADIHHTDFWVYGQ